MINFLLNLLGFSRIKLVLIAFFGIGLLASGVKIYYTIVENVENRIKVQQLEQSVKDKDAFIIKMQEDLQLRDNIIKERDDYVTTLEKEYEKLTTDLGDDENNPAPKSIQELMDRLNKLQGDKK